jgi:hypothetical protein
MQTHQDPKDFHWQIVHSLWSPKQVAMLEQLTFNKTHKGPKAQKKHLFFWEPKHHILHLAICLFVIFMKLHRFAPTNGKSVSKIGIKATQLKTTCERNRET